MNRSESKFKHTADRMDGALIALLEDKEFSEISIIDICQKAGVNRSTFYAHYDNTHDLLCETYRNLIDNFLKECAFDSAETQREWKELYKNDLNFVKPKYLLPYLRYIRRHQRLYKIFVDNAHAFEIDDTDDEMIEKFFVPIYETYGVSDKRLILYMQKYFLKGIAAIINEWVRRNCEDDISFICDAITFCIRPMTH